MIRFEARLAPGKKVPYDKWTFVVIPAEIAAKLGTKGTVAVRGKLAGARFRGTINTGEGVRRMSVPRPLLQQAGVRRGLVTQRK